MLIKQIKSLCLLFECAEPLSKISFPFITLTLFYLRSLLTFSHSAQYTCLVVWYFTVLRWIDLTRPLMTQVMTTFYDLQAITFRDNIFLFLNTIHINQNLTFPSSNHSFHQRDIFIITIPLVNSHHWWNMIWLNCENSTWSKNYAEPALLG